MGALPGPPVIHPRFPLPVRAMVVRQQINQHAPRNSRNSRNPRNRRYGAWIGDGAGGGSGLVLGNPVRGVGGL